ncbi:uncharacterized protein LOC108033694 [Drosophila biarmipes]|uniref:uncharacterized protein LOC108033694 n=1 Tax=Drosophila biarmipes TaxID=125945 RepID=UPI0007E6FC2C|nr:uncharacterized protein LOC108033694 [Drosophila biarmipes]
MSTSFKSRIPERVKHSLTALHGPLSRVSRSGSIARPNVRGTMYRSKLPLPIRMLTALVREVPPEAVVAADSRRPETEKETEAVIRSLVRRSIPPAVRGNRTSFRRIQLAHSSPQVASVSLTMAPTNRWQNASALSPHQKPHTVQPPVAQVEQRHRPEDEVVSARGLIELVAGKWQPEMKMTRFLCSDHRLINVPSRLMYRYSEVMCHLEVEEQPIELRAIRSVTLLRLVMWMHQKSLSESESGNGNGNVEPLLTAGREQGCICADQSIAQEQGNGNGSGNGNENTENSCEIIENTQENDASMDINAESIISEMFDAYSGSEDETPENSSESSESTEAYESVDFEIRNGYENAKSSCERTEQRLFNRIFKVYNQSGYGDAENSGKNCENAENVIYKKTTDYTEGNAGNAMVESCILHDICKMANFANGMRFRSAGNITSNTGNTQTKARTGNDLRKESGSEQNANSCGSGGENTRNIVFGNNSQDRFVFTPKTVGIFRENSGNGDENGKEKGTVEGSCLSENIFRTSGKPNFSEINQNGNGNENANANDSGNASEQRVPIVESSGGELSSWEQRLLGGELYHLVELILAAHYLGVDSLTLLATHHFGELMAQRTRTEMSLMLKIRTHLAGVRQTLDNHRPRIREILTQESPAKQTNHLRPQQGSPAFSAVNKELESGPNRLSSIRSARRAAAPCAIESPAPLCSNRHRHHQNCFHSSF